MNLARGAAALSASQLKRAGLTPAEVDFVWSCTESGMLLDALLWNTIRGDDQDLRKVMQHALVLAQAIFRSQRSKLPRLRGRADVWYFEAVRAPQAPAGRGRGMLIEYDARCLYCNTSLNTIAPTYRQIPREFFEPVERHGEECALRFLMLTETERAMARTRSLVQKLLRKKRGIR